MKKPKLELRVEIRTERETGRQRACVVGPFESTISVKDELKKAGLRWDGSNWGSPNIAIVQQVVKTLLEGGLVSPQSAGLQPFNPQATAALADLFTAPERNAVEEVAKAKLATLELPSPEELFGDD